MRQPVCQGSPSSTLGRQSMIIYIYTFQKPFGPVFIWENFEILQKVVSPWISQMIPSKWAFGIM